MPPFVPAKCPYCKKDNTFDWLELTASKPGARLFSKLPVERADEIHQFFVTCQHCHEHFKIKVEKPGGEK
jgi:hypothetical protein